MESCLSDGNGLYSFVIRNYVFSGCISMRYDRWGHKGTRFKKIEDYKRLFSGTIQQFVANNRFVGINLVYTIYGTVARCGILSSPSKAALGNINPWKTSLKRKGDKLS